MSREQDTAQKVMDVVGMMHDLEDPIHNEQVIERMQCRLLGLLVVEIAALTDEIITIDSKIPPR